MSEKPTYNQINEQISSAYMNRSDADPTVLVESTDGAIAVGRLEKGTHTVHFTEGGKEIVKQDTPLEVLSDEHQEKLAAELGATRAESLIPRDYEPYSDEQSRRVMRVKRSSGEIDNGWTAMGEGVDSKGRAYYKVVKSAGEGEGLFKKNVDKIETDTLNAGEREKALADKAIGQVVSPEASIGASAEKQSAEEALIEQFQKLKERVSERDQAAFWQYSTALYHHEQDSARSKMSSALLEDRVLLSEGQRIWTEVRKARGEKKISVYH